MKKLSLLLFAVSLSAQGIRPNISNARFVSQAYQGDLKRQLTSSSPAWFGYAAKTPKTDRQGCCWGDQNRYGCRLEGGTTNVQGSGSEKSPIPLEGSDRIAILFRIDNAGIGKIHISSLECPLDGGGLPFVWIDDVPASASLSLLENVVQTTGNDGVISGSILAIAQHDTGQADVLLEKFTRSSFPEKVREKSVFWLGAARGAHGVPILQQLLKADPSEHIRDKAVFALSISKQPEALGAIVEAAKSDRSPHVRTQALFWLSQKAGDRAASTIMNAVNNDPDTQVKEKAVFALSQLPKDEGIPKLIQVASDQRNPQVKKKAFFWLGQSGDPRALAFIESVLVK